MGRNRISAYSLPPLRMGVVGWKKMALMTPQNFSESAEDPLDYRKRVGISSLKNAAAVDTSRYAIA